MSYVTGLVGLGHRLRCDGYEEKIKLARNQFQPQRLNRWAGEFHPAGPAEARHSHGPLIAFRGHSFSGLPLEANSTPPI